MSSESVFCLCHIHRLGENDDEKFIGVYRTEEDAKAAIERLKDKPGFVQTQDGFLIDRYELNKDHWVEGFTTLYPERLD